MRQNKARAKVIRERLAARIDAAKERGDQYVQNMATRVSAGGAQPADIGKFMVDLIRWQNAMRDG